MDKSCAKLFTIYVFVFEIPRFSCLKTLLNITHDSKEISNPDTVLLSFMTTGRVRLSHFEKILTTETGVGQSSNRANFFAELLGKTR